MARIDYRVVSADPRKAPKGKLPYITDGNITIADSAFIIDYLVKTYGDRVDNGLSAREKAEAHAITKMCEESLYWAGFYSRWADEKNWKILRIDFFKSLPPFFALSFQVL